LSVAELEVDRATEAAELLRGRPEVDEVAHYGHLLRLATRDGTDAKDLAEKLLLAGNFRVTQARRARASVEDAFVSMVRSEHKARERRASA